MDAEKQRLKNEDDWMNEESCPSGTALFFLYRVKKFCSVKGCVKAMNCL